MKATWANITDLRPIKNAGFNTVLDHFNFVYWDDARREKTLKSASDNGMGYIPVLDPLLRDGKINEAKSIVSKYKDNPAIIGWLLLDEPQLHRTPVSTQKTYYNAIKSIDPTHNLYTTFLPDPMKSEYYSTDTFDIAMLDEYPLQKGVANWKNTLNAHLGAWISSTGNRDVIPNLQGFKDDSQFLNPIGTIEGQYNIYKDRGMVGKGYAMYSWQGYKGGISQISGLLSEVASFNPKITDLWPPSIIIPPTPPQPIPPPPTGEYIVIDTQKINIPQCVGKTADGKWWAVWNNTRYWIRHWDIVQSMQSQGISTSSVSQYSASSINIPPFPENLIYKPTPPTPITTPGKEIVLYSEPNYDGHVSDGRNVDTSSNQIQIRFHGVNEHYRGFLSFNTSGIPDNAVIKSAYLRTYAHWYKENYTHRAYVDYCLYGTLDANDWGRTPEALNIATWNFHNTTLGWFNSPIFTNVNKTGRSQYRLRSYTTDHAEMSIRSGNYSGYAPELHVIYEIPETFITNTITHTCKAKISYNISSYPNHNITIYCPYCKKALAEKGVAGSARLISLPPEVITMKQVTCGKCQSILKVSISSYADNNKILACPICGTGLSIKGTKVEVVSTPFIDSLKKAIADLDAKLNQLEKAIKEIRDKIDAIKKELSL